MAKYNTKDGLLDAYSLYDAANSLGLFSGSAASGVTAGMAPLGGASSAFTASQVPISLGGTMVPGASTGAALPSMSSLGAGAVAALPALLGAFGGIPSGKANHERREGARQDMLAQNAIANLPIPAGMSHQEYVKDKTPPKSPWDYAMDGIPDTDDGMYEQQQMANYFQNGDGKAKMEAFYKANPEWYTPTGERIYKYKEDADAINQMAPSGIVNPLTQEQVDIMNQRGIDAQMPTTQKSGVLPPPETQEGALQVTTPDRVRWLQENAPKQTYNGQELYAPMQQYKNQWRMK